MCPNFKKHNKPESHFEETRGFKKHKNNNITIFLTSRLTTKKYVFLEGYPQRLDFRNIQMFTCAETNCLATRRGRSVTKKKTSTGKWTTTDFCRGLVGPTGGRRPTGLTYGPDIDGGTWAGKSICSSICPKDPDMP